MKSSTTSELSKTLVADLTKLLQSPVGISVELCTSSFRLAWYFWHKCHSIATTHTFTQRDLNTSNNYPAGLLQNERARNFLPVAGWRCGQLCVAWWETESKAADAVLCIVFDARRWFKTPDSCSFSTPRKDVVNTWKRVDVPTLKQWKHTDCWYRLETTCEMWM